ncbi:hypothetical protein [Cyanobacterium aponinum]|uniref:hypothetical protein n=1 Tax=Cyanobacterium aponinum TaxID=379064 RepID=UPI0018ACF72E|nr:hypothetical protein [Cyanobacterium aponinum]
MVVIENGQTFLNIAYLIDYPEKRQSEKGKGQETRDKRQKCLINTNPISVRVEYIQPLPPATCNLKPIL